MGAWRRWCWVGRRRATTVRSYPAVASSAIRGGGTAWIRACRRRRPRRAWGSRQVWTFTSRTFVATSGPTAMSVGAAALGVVRQRSVPVVRWLSEYEMSSKWVSGGGVGRGVAGGSAARCCGSAGWDSPVRRPAAPGPARGGRLAAPGLGEHAQGRNRPLEPTDGCQHDARGGGGHGSGPASVAGRSGRGVAVRCGPSRPGRSSPPRARPLGRLDRRPWAPFGSRGIKMQGPP